MNNKTHNNMKNRVMGEEFFKEYQNFPYSIILLKMSYKVN